MGNNVIHNLFIDHVDKAAPDNGFHHHHGDGGDIIIHKHDGRYFGDGNITYVGNDHGSKHRHKVGYDKYGPPAHDHLTDDE